MKNILIVNCVFDPEPVVSAQIGSSLAEVLSKSDNNVTLIAPYPSRPLGFKFDKFKKKTNSISKFISKKQLTCYYLPSYIYPKSGIIGRLRESISFGIASYRFIMSSKENYNVVYMNTWPIFGQLGVTLACLRRKIPYVVHIMDIYPESISKRLPFPLKELMNLLLMPIEKFILNKAKRIIAISNKMKTYLKESRSLDEEKIYVVLNWQDDKEFALDEKVINNEKKVFMYLGNIGPVAGIPLLIESFSKLNAKLIIAGSGSYKYNCEQFSKKFTNLDIEFLDVPLGKVAEVQSKADVMLLPIMKGYANTSIPSKLPAYMLSAKPILVIADLESDSVETVIKAKCGWAVEYENPILVIEKINDILKVESAKLREIGLAGAVYAKNNFSKSINLTKLKTAILN